MENKDRYRRNAEECLRLAQSATPQHRATLRKMAETWRRPAEELAGRSSTPARTSHKADRSASLGGFQPGAGPEASSSHPIKSLGRATKPKGPNGAPAPPRTGLVNKVLIPPPTEMG